VVRKGFHSVRKIPKIRQKKLKFKGEFIKIHRKENSGSLRLTEAISLYAVSLAVKGNLEGIHRFKRIKKVDA
jgi:hypothetical protein